MEHVRDWFDRSPAEIARGLRGGQLGGAGMDGSAEEGGSEAEQKREHMGRPWSNRGAWSRAPLSPSIPFRHVSICLGVGSTGQREGLLRGCRSHVSARCFTDVVSGAAPRRLRTAPTLRLV